MIDVLNLRTTKNLLADWAQQTNAKLRKDYEIAKNK
jgi:hypothetical protein